MDSATRLPRACLVLTNHHLNRRECLINASLMMPLRVAALELDLNVRVCLFALQQALVYYWTRYVVAPAKPGLPRLLRVVLAVPLVCSGAFLFHPSAPDEFALTLYATSNCIWVCLSKLWAFSANRGQLVKSFETRNNAAFAFGLLFPLVVAFNEIPVSKKDTSSNSSPSEAVQNGFAYRDARFSVVQLPWKSRILQVAKNIVGIVLKVCFVDCSLLSELQLLQNAVVALIAEFIDWATAGGHLFWRDVGYGYFLCFSTSMMEGTIGTIALLGFNIKAEPSFNSPWLSQSLTELWSKRYHLPVTQALKDSVHDPIYEGSWMHGEQYLGKPKKSLTRRLVAVVTTFFFSGWFHSMIAVVAFDLGFPFLHGSFFAALGGVVLLEISLKVLSKKWNLMRRIAQRIPSVVWMFYTHAVVLYLSHVLYWPAAIAFGLTDNLVHSFTSPYRGN